MYICNMKKEFKIKLLQILANYVISMLEHSHSESMFYYYFEIGAMIDAYAIEYHDIYLD
jgi:hypothetical protein